MKELLFENKKVLDVGCGNGWFSIWADRNGCLVDAIDPSVIQIKDARDKDETNKLSNFYKNHTKCINKNHIFVDLVSAALIKYTINSFLATKVIFFNEIKKIFDKSNTGDSWKNFIDALSSDNRIGNSHMQVPGPDGREGFGGACFPKDTSALLDYSKEINSNFDLLEKVISLNNKIRAEYNKPTERELEQNIGFNKNK